MVISLQEKCVNFAQFFDGKLAKKGAFGFTWSVLSSAQIKIEIKHTTYLSPFLLRDESTTLLNQRRFKT